MPRSMTGFGRGEAMGRGKKFTVELKSVNHRFAEVVLRLPKQFFSLEERARRVVLEKVARGRVDGYVSAERYAEKVPRVKVDKELASSYYKAMEELLKGLGIKDSIRPDHIFSLPGVINVEETDEEAEDWWPVLVQAVRAALDGLMEMRESEGSRLRDDLLTRLERIRKLTSIIEARAPMVVEDYRSRLTQRLAEWLEESALDMNRVMAEVVVYGERSNITEEIIRLYSHITQAAGSLADDGPVGRKLDFIIQEMNREINTIASKSADVQISGIVVEVKSELEKIREQVQNLE